MRINLVAITIAVFMAMTAGCGATSTKSPSQADAEAGSILGRNNDAALQKMVADVLPKFRQAEFVDQQTGLTIKYSLFSPADANSGKKYPLVMVMGDSGSTGTEAQDGLNSYGALIWATPADQAKNPCYVLVPQFSGLDGKDVNVKSPEIASAYALLLNIVGKNNIDPARIYVVGQSLGGLMAMDLCLLHPNAFAASMFVDCPINREMAQRLVKQNFILISFGDSASVQKTNEVIEDAGRKYGRSWSYSSWSESLPKDVQESQAQTILSKKAPVILINIEQDARKSKGTAENAQLSGPDQAYNLAPCREWLFKHVKSRKGR